MSQIVLRIKKILITLVAGLSIGLTGCSSWKDFSIVHTPEIQQGNIITPEMMAEIETGMSKRQVRFVLGTPLLVDVFHQERWDYLFTMKKRNEPLEIKQLSLFFDDDTLIIVSPSPPTPARWAARPPRLTSSITTQRLSWRFWRRSRPIRLERSSSPKTMWSS